MTNFIKGKQPCDNYDPQIEANRYATWSNIHECYAPFKEGPKCGGLVSFCLNCSRDHHNGGYETCGATL